MKNKNTAFFGHPIGLLTLFSTEMWERFNYYGMRALLMLFLTASFATGGFGMEQNDAQVIYGIFTGLVYVTPIIGGMLADKILGQRKTIYIGAMTMAIGQFLLAYSAIISPETYEYKQTIFFIGLGVLICGNGFFKPNISTMVGDLYDISDPRRDGAFTIFYMGINIGATIGPFIAGWLGEDIAWEYGFLAAAVAMLIGFTWFYFSHGALGTTGMPPKYNRTKTKLMAKDRLDIVMYIAGIVGLVAAFVLGWKQIPDIIQNIIIITVAVVGVGYLGSNIYKNTNGKTEWSRVGVILVLALVNIFFWSGFEQTGSTLNIFIRDQVDRTIGNFEIPATWFQTINAIFIVLFAPLFTLMWAKLDKWKMNPNTPMKFSWSLFLLSAGFVVMAFANERASTGILVSPLWLVAVFMLHTWGELFMSPIGLSMVTKLSPAKLVSTMMGIWMGSFALGNYLAAMLKPIVEKFDLPLYWFIAIETAIVGVIMAIAAPFLKKMMKGLK
ncbi:peptide MFS transporter [Saccharicrinis sp. FJH62]|uniref:peptide MFS transporter n=1 Tax=Saccharicrinis sp. FJH62 TaxID=3344657 RepID=UPI0035D51A3F